MNQNPFDIFEEKNNLEELLADLTNLSTKTKDELLITCNQQIKELSKKIKILSFKAYCDIMTTIALNSKELKQTGLAIEDLVFENNKRIYNRTYWETIYRPNNQNLVADCYLLDVNNLKLTNDNYGHQKGDFVISKTAIIANDFGTTIRLGGDEFLLIVTEKKEEFKAFLEKHQDELPFSYGLSIKTANKPFSLVLAEADKAMYNYKRKFKNLHNFNDCKGYSATKSLDDKIREEEKDEIEIENQNQIEEYNSFIDLFS